MILKTHYYNINIKNSKPRIYIESRDLELSGFKSGEKYYPVYSKGKIELYKKIHHIPFYHYGMKKRIVSIQKDSQSPVLDFCNAKMQGFNIGGKCRVEYSTNKITIERE